MDVENSLRTLQGLDMMQHDLLTIILPYVEAENRTSVELYIRTVMMKSIENTLNLAFASAGWEKIGNDDEDGGFYAPTGVLTSLSDWVCILRDVELQGLNEPGLERGKQRGKEIIRQCREMGFI